MTMTNNEAELREQVNKLLDFFTEPGQGEKYLKDLENDLVAIISDHTRKARISELEKLSNVAVPYVCNGKRLADGVPVSTISYRLAALKQPTVEEE